MSTKTDITPATRAISNRIDEYLELQDAIDALEERRANLSTYLINRLGVGTTVVNDLAQVTVVQNVTSDLDFDQLVLLRPTWARKVTKKVFDRSKFGLLRKANEVPADVLELVTEKVSAPHLRITRK